MAPAFKLPFSIPVSPARRVIAIDAGSHSFKVLLVEELFGRVRLLRHELIDLQEEGLLSAGEISKHLQTVLREFGSHPVALVLPQHRSLSQVIDLPAAIGEEVRHLIEEETVKLSGLSESAIAFDYAPLTPFGRNQNPFWVTLCQESEILGQVNRLGLEEEDVCDVTTTANALAAAYRVLQPAADRVVLVDLGASNTVVTILVSGQAVHGGSFPFGSDTFTDEIAAQGDGSFRSAETLKCTRNLLAPGDGAAPLSKKVESWRHDLERMLKECLADQGEPPSALESFQVVLCGGGALQPGLIEYLNQRGSMRYSAWPDGADAKTALPSGRFAVAFGAALQTLGRNPQPASLLPLQLRAVWKKHRSLELLHSIGAMVLVATALVLAFGTWQKLRLVERKKTLLTQSQAALEKTHSTESLATLLAQQYESLRPILQRQKETWDTLKTLALLQQVRSNRNFWYVLLADQRSYFAARPIVQTNSPPAQTGSATNPPPQKYGFVAELCVPEEPEAMRRVVSQLVTDLKRDPLFRNVDALSAEWRRNLVDPKLLIPDRSISLELELAATEFLPIQKPPERKPSSTTPDLRSPQRSSGRNPERANGPPSPRGQ
ncbi:MAG TPA: pilus assembly protein PilM [Verrucomicrobiae bacterium]|nr:pilus assembly protein PilM [Verrucomicrobiae bacterium]